MHGGFGPRFNGSGFGNVNRIISSPQNETLDTSCKDSGKIFAQARGSQQLFRVDTGGKPSALARNTEFERAKTSVRKSAKISNHEAETPTLPGSQYSRATTCFEGHSVFE